MVSFKVLAIKVVQIAIPIGIQCQDIQKAKDGVTKARRLEDHKASKKSVTIYVFDPGGRKSQVKINLEDNIHEDMNGLKGENLSGTSLTIISIVTVLLVLLCYVLQGSILVGLVEVRVLLSFTIF